MYRIIRTRYAAIAKIAKSSENIMIIAIAIFGSTSGALRIRIDEVRGRVPLEITDVMLIHVHAAQTGFEHILLMLCIYTYGAGRARADRSRSAL